VNEYAAINITQNGVRQTGRMRRRGHSSRYFPKPSFHVITNNDKRHFVSSNIDKSYLRQIFANTIFEKAGFAVPKTEHVALSVNGVFAGLYLYREPIDSNFFRRRNIRINSLYEIRSGARFTFEGGFNTAMSFEKHIPQSSVNFSDLNILISALDSKDSETISDVLDIENAALYSLISSAINNSDGITKNLYIYNDKRDGKFRIIPYDLDLTFGQTLFDGVVSANTIHKFENGLLERAEEIFLNAAGAKRQDIISNILYNMAGYADNQGILSDLKVKISQAYGNDPYLRGENLYEHFEKIRMFIEEAANIR